MLSFPSDCLDMATVCAATKVDIDVTFPFHNTSRLLVSYMNVFKF